MKTIGSLLIAGLFATLTFAVWAYLNRPTPEPPWPKRIQGFAFSPFRASEDPTHFEMPTDAEIEADLQLLEGQVNAVRTYSVGGTLSDVPELADRHGLNVALGAWLDADRDKNEEQLRTVIDLANTHQNVVRVIIGNEVLFRGDLKVEELARYLDRARASIGQPVGTAETWHTWLAYPELAQHVDFIGVHLLPYWEGVAVDRAVDYSFSQLRRLQKASPHKPIVIAEIGWPSRGRTRESAVASDANEALFLRRFLQRAEQEQIVYYVMEAFDQPWKAYLEGAVGSYWGVYDVNRHPKFAFTAPIVRVPEWHILAAASVAVALVVLGLLYLNSDSLRNRGRSFLAVVVYATATIAVWVIYDFTQQYMTLSSVIAGVLLLLGMLGVMLVLLAEAHEWAEAHWVEYRRRLGAPLMSSDARSPRVSIHVPAYNEPPAMLIETLDALARLDYPDFEVLVIDNNTRDAAVWRPVEAHCAQLGPRFRFFHVAPLAGFKAGALNYALARTAPDAEIVAVIDSDYVVDARWLRDLTPAFRDQRIAIVQAPQDYRDEGASAFKAMCYAEYRGFFHIGMITRNERNAIIQHGTMTMVRRRQLEDCGGWAEWCITEDAELGLRIFEAGFDASFVPSSYGRGLMPDTFVDFKKQRFRWAYGAMQILKAHARALFLEGGPLSPGQRYHFIAGWLPWTADGCNLLFNLAALAWSVAMVWAPRHIEPPLVVYSVLPLSLFTFKLAKLIHLYHARVGANTRQTLAAAVAGLALTHTIGKAAIKGLLTRDEPFFRTPKQGHSPGLAGALLAAREETLMMLGLLLSAWGVAHAPQAAGLDRVALAGPDRLAWIVVLLVQSVPYASSLLMSLMSAFPLPGRLLGTGYRRITAAGKRAEADPAR
ncbi:MAG: glycosyltransferase [Gammaproteobacteria bacterium]|nr:MAG: glycosyltransferase [Gammaproteobacteria bacterium]TLZ08122.1 MAG: glycosyltransferase [Gammaproteobacteria bacterium]TLZ20632.1 MAG: glycosyltransferase [Gammaproteobacteria bacterium]